jgi:hypothetical protein
MMGVFTQFMGDYAVAKASSGSRFSQLVLATCLRLRVPTGELHFCNHR